MRCLSNHIEALQMKNLQKCKKYNAYTQCLRAYVNYTVIIWLGKNGSWDADKMFLCYRKIVRMYFRASLSRHSLYVTEILFYLFVCRTCVIKVWFDLTCFCDKRPLDYVLRGCALVSANKGIPHNLTPPSGLRICFAFGHTAVVVDPVQPSLIILNGERRRLYAVLSRHCRRWGRHTKDDWQTVVINNLQNDTHRDWPIARFSATAELLVVSFREK